MKHSYHKSNILVTNILQQRFSAYLPTRIRHELYNSDGLVEQDRGLICKFPPTYCKLICTQETGTFCTNHIVNVYV